MTVRTRVTFDLTLPRLQDALELTALLRAGNTDVLKGRDLEVVQVTNIVEPNPPEEE